MLAQTKLLEDGMLEWMGGGGMGTVWGLPGLSLAVKQAVRRAAAEDGCHVSYALE